jgi:hypothetical protein
MTTTFKPPKAIPGTPNADVGPPQIASSDRNVFILWHEFPPGFDPANANQDIYIARSTNRGNSFSARVNLSNSLLVDSRDEDIALSDDNVFVVWSDDGDRVMFTRSTNNGSSFDPPKQISGAGQATHPQVIARGRRVYVVWDALGQNGSQDVFFVESDNNGQTFTAEKNISNNDEESSFPQLVRSDDRIVVTWRDASIAGMGAETFFSQGS